MDAGAHQRPLTRSPSVGEVRAIAGLPDPVLRNLRITACYADLAAAVAERTAPGSNWCTFATWASKQAGCTIRGEDVLDDLQRELGDAGSVLHPIATGWRMLVRRGLFTPGTRLGRAVRELHTPFDAVERASEAVARGNRKVFAEIGLEFARFLAADDVDAFIEELRPGDPPDGQQLLRQAFRRYATDAATDPQAMLLANLEIGLHEQTRLQPEILAAMDAAAGTREDLGRRLVRGLFGRELPRLLRPLTRPLDAVGRRLQRELDEVSRRVITRHLMVLTFPGGVAISLGRDLEAAIPEALRRLDHPELLELLARFEPAAGRPDHTAARDWSVLAQRMHFIIHLFRAYAASPALAGAPFSPRQLEAIRAGRTPDGAL